MASRRLTNAIKEHITDSVIKTTLEDRIESLIKFEQTFAKKLRLELIGSKNLATMESLPGNYFPTRNGINVSVGGTYFKRIDYRSDCHDGYVGQVQRHNVRSLDFGEGLKLPAELADTITNFNKDSANGKLLLEIRKDWDKLYDDALKLRNELRVVLAAFTTVQKLIEKFPELEKHLPKFEQQTKSLVPSPDRLHKLIECASSGAGCS